MKLPLYFLTALLYFWVPVLAAGPRIFFSLDPLSKRAFLLCLAIFYPLAAGMEYVYLYFDIWTFSEKIDPLLGLRVYGAPIEEFVYWFGAVPFALIVYLSFCRLFGREDGRFRPWSPAREWVPAGPRPVRPFGRAERTEEKERVSVFER